MLRSQNRRRFNRSLRCAKIRRRPSEGEDSVTKHCRQSSSAMPSAHRRVGFRLASARRHSPAPVHESLIRNERLDRRGQKGTAPVLVAVRSRQFRPPAHCRSWRKCLFHRPTGRPSVRRTNHSVVDWIGELTAGGRSIAGVSSHAASAPTVHECTLESEVNKTRHAKPEHRRPPGGACIDQRDKGITRPCSHSKRSVKAGRSTDDRRRIGAAPVELPLRILATVPSFRTIPPLADSRKERGRDQD